MVYTYLRYQYCICNLSLGITLCYTCAAFLYKHLRKLIFVYLRHYRHFHQFVFPPSLSLFLSLIFLFDYLYLILFFSCIFISSFLSPSTFSKHFIMYYFLFPSSLSHSASLLLTPIRFNNLRDMLCNHSESLELNLTTWINY